MNIPLVKVPTFTLHLPYSKRDIKYRPYLVKEEKLLTMANESENTEDILQAIGDIVKSCTFDQVDIETDPMFEVQQVFLQIRGKSVGENLEFYSICGNCEHKTDTTMSVNDFTLKTTPGHSNTIKLNENFSVVMKYPTFRHFTKLYVTEEENAIFDVICECIDKVYSDDEVFENTKDTSREVKQFLENLTLQQFEKIENFFVTMPILQHQITYDCPSCSFKNTLLIDGITNFFD